MTNLEKTGLFSQVILKTLQHESIRDINVKSFEISCVKIPVLTPEMKITTEKPTKTPPKKKAKK